MKLYLKTSINLVSFILNLLLVTCNDEISFTPVISTKYGKLRGFYHNVPGYPTVAQYLGVPYATPPTAANRFSPTRTLSHWPGIYDATKFSPSCPQKTNDSRLRDQSEDCLYLNLYVPASG